MNGKGRLTPVYPAVGPEDLRCWFEHFTLRLWFSQERSIGKAPYSLYHQTATQLGKGIVQLASRHGQWEWNPLL